MSHIYITGDTHGSFHRFTMDEFPAQKDMTRDDYVIICGDFGGIWDDGRRDAAKLKFLESLPFTILFVDGNHENFDALYKLPVSEWNGGKVHFVRENVIHLMRGQVFTINGKKFFTMGGAQSHDIQDGILEPKDPDFDEKFFLMHYSNAYFRVNHQSWWKEELPSEEEYEEAMKNLKKAKFQVDYIITHCAPTSIQDKLNKEEYEPDRLTDFLDKVLKKTKFRTWSCGHYHIKKYVNTHWVNQFNKTEFLQVFYDDILIME